MQTLVTLRWGRGAAIQSPTATHGAARGILSAATRTVPIQGGTNNPALLCLGGFILKKAKIRAAMLPQRGAAGAARVPPGQVRARGRCPGPAASQQRPRAAGSACGCLTDCPPAPCTSVSSLQVLGRFQED